MRDGQAASLSGVGSGTVAKADHHALPDSMHATDSWHVHPAAFAAVVFVVGLGVGLVLFFVSQASLMSILDQEFEVLTADLRGAVESVVQKNLGDLEALEAFFTVTCVTNATGGTLVAPSVSPALFDAFAARMVRGNQQVQAVEYIPHVFDDAMRARVEAEVVAHYGLDAGSTFRAVRADGAAGTEPAPASGGPYFPVAYLHPLAGNEPAHLFDLNSSGARAQAMHDAASSASAVASEPIRLVQRANEPGVLVFRPVYSCGRGGTYGPGPDSVAAASTGSSTGATAHEAPDVTGFVLAVFRAQVLLEGALKAELGLEPAVWAGVYHAASGTPLFAGGRGATTDLEGAPVTTPPEPEDASATRRAEFTLDFGGQDWTVVVAEVQTLGTEGQHREPWLSLSAPLAFSVIAAVTVIYGSIRTRRHSAALVQASVRATDRTHQYLVSYLCHELRNPLHACLAYVDLLAFEMDGGDGGGDSGGSSGHSPSSLSVKNRGSSQAAGVTTDASVRLGSGGAQAIGLRSPSGRRGGAAGARDTVVPRRRALQDVRAARAAAKQMARVLDDVMDMRQVDTGDLTIAPTFVPDCGAIVRDLANQYRFLVDPAVRLYLDVPGGAQSRPAYIDSNRLRQVMGHGLHRAARSTSSGKITLSAAVLMPTMELQRDEAEAAARGEGRGPRGGGHGGVTASSDDSSSNTGSSGAGASGSGSIARRAERRRRGYQSPGSGSSSSSLHAAGSRRRRAVTTQQRDAARRRRLERVPWLLCDVVYRPDESLSQEEVHWNAVTQQRHQAGLPAWVSSALRRRTEEVRAAVAETAQPGAGFLRGSTTGSSSMEEKAAHLVNQITATLKDMPVDAVTSRHLRARLDSGMGLGLCLNLVRAMDGLLGVQGISLPLPRVSPVAMFWVAIPLPRDDASALLNHSDGEGTFADVAFPPTPRGRAAVEVEKGRVPGGAGAGAGVGAGAGAGPEALVTPGTAFTSSSGGLSKSLRDGLTTGSMVEVDFETAEATTTSRREAAAGVAPDKTAITVVVASREAKPVSADESKSRGATADSRSPPPIVASTTAPAVAEPVDPASLRVAVVDDEPVLRKVTSRFLNRAKVPHILLEDGTLLEEELIDGKNSEGITVVLLDIVMRHSNGAVVCRRLREAGVTLPIYAMTANTDDVSRRLYKDAGFNGVLGKPFTYKELRATLGLPSSTTKRRRRRSSTRRVAPAPATTLAAATGPSSPRSGKSLSRGSGLELRGRAGSTSDRYVT